MQCDFEWMPCVDTLQLILHDILEMLGLGRCYGELSWCPVRTGWPPKDQELLVFFQDDRRIIDGFCVPGFMLRAPCLISHSIFATTLWNRWRYFCSSLLHCGLQVLVTLRQSTWKMIPCTVWHLSLLNWQLDEACCLHCALEGKNLHPVILFSHWKVWRIMTHLLLGALKNLCRGGGE